MQRSETFLDVKNPNCYNDRTWIHGCGDSVSRPGLGPAGQRTDVRSGCGSSSSVSRSQPLTSSPCQRQGCGTGLHSGLSEGTKCIGDRDSLEQQTVASRFPLQGGVWRALPAQGWGRAPRSSASLPLGVRASQACLERSRLCLGCLRLDNGAVAGSQ